jgi:hypothetical protein
MSTSLGVIKGEVEIPNTKKQNSDYKYTELHVTKFYGGHRRGTSVQLSIVTDSIDHIQIPQSEIPRLIEMLKQCI